MTSFIAQAASSTAAPAAPPVWRVLTEVLWFAALSGVLGGTVAYVLAIAPPLRRADGPARVVAGRAGLVFGVLGPVFIVAAWLQLAATVARGMKGMSFGAALSPAVIADYLDTPAAPTEWIAPTALLAVQYAIFVVAGLLLAVLLVPSVRTRVRDVVATAGALAVLSTVIGAVPSSAGTTVKVLGRVFIQLHIHGGATWLGGLGLLAGLAFAARRVPGAADVWAAAWSRFSLLALVAVGEVLVSGLWLTWTHVGTPAQLVTTVYGQFLLVKMLLVVAMLVAGAFNQLALLPRIARVRRADAEGTSLVRLTLRHFPRVVAAEAVLGLAVLVIVPFLSGSARKQAGETGSPAIDGPVLLVGALFVAMLVVSFVSAVRLGGRLGRPEVAVAA